MIYNFILGQPFAIKMQSQTNALPTASKHFDNIHSFTLVMWVKFTSLTERQVILQVAREEKNNAGNTCTFSRFLLDGGELKCDGDWFDDAKFPVIIIYSVFYKKKKLKDHVALNLVFRFQRLRNTRTLAKVNIAK